MNGILDRCGVETDKSIAAGAHTLVAGMRILIVEDNSESVILLRVYLESLSPSLDFAVNGLEALEKRRQSDYDLILMDMQMPVMDGYTAIREIRAWEKMNGARRTPVVALTAHAINGAHGNSLEAGCDGHLTKPLARNALLLAITEFGRRPTDVPLCAPIGVADGTDEGISESIKGRRSIFLANRSRDLEKLQSASACLDFATIRTIAHNCKGIGTGYGFPAISRIGAEMSTAAKALDVDKLRECFGDFAACLRAATS